MYSLNPQYSFFISCDNTANILEPSKSPGIPRPIKSSGRESRNPKPIESKVMTTGLSRESENLDFKLVVCQANNCILNEAVDPQPSTNIQTVSLQVSNLIENTIRIEEIFLKVLLEEHGQNADTPQFRQFQAEYQCEFPAAKLDTSRDLLKCLHTIAEWVNSPEFILPKSQFMLLRGCAGVGKTHAIVDHALHSSKTGQVCLVFYGEDFTGDEPWKIIVNKLGLSSNVTRDELWGMIDSAAETTGKPAIIYIDALNESPEMQRWKTSWLAPLCQQITHFSRLKLCVSCRDTYLDEVFDNRNQWVEFEHNGFLGCEFYAIKQFFEFYKLEPPTTPLLQFILRFLRPIIFLKMLLFVTGAMRFCEVRQKRCDR